MRQVEPKALLSIILLFTLSLEGRSIPIVKYHDICLHVIKSRFKFLYFYLRSHNIATQAKR